MGLIVGRVASCIKVQPHASARMVEADNFSRISHINRSAGLLAASKGPA